MYSKVQDEVFEGIITAALNEFIIEEMNSLPSDEEISKMYPAPKKLIKKYRRKVKEREYKLPLPLVYFKRIAFVCLVVISVSFGVLATSEQVRAAIADTVVTWFDKYVQIDFGKKSESPKVDESTSQITEIPNVSDLNFYYVPEGFELASSTEDTNLREYIYTAENGDYLIISICATETTEIAVDAEDNEYEKMSINGNDAYVLYSDTDRAGTLVTGNSVYTIMISSILEKSDLIKVAENIK